MDYQALIDASALGCFRSEAYVAGLTAWLRQVHEGVPAADGARAYPLSSAERDAFYAGVDAGRALLPSTAPSQVKPDSSRMPTYVRQENGGQIVYASDRHEGLSYAEGNS